MIKILRSLLWVLFFLSATSSFAQFPFSETFKGSTAKGLVLGGSPVPAVLTAGTIDPEGEGYLRLTTNGGGQTGYVYCNYIFPSTKGFSVDFEYFTYGNTNVPPGADGISFFLFDASANPFNIGAFGGALGYAQRYVQESNGNIIDLPGVSKGYLGIGLDEWGNFAKADEGRQGGLAYQTIHAVTLRGAGNGNALIPQNYPFLITQKTENLPAPFNFQINGGSRSSTSPDKNGYRKAIFELEPRPGGGYYVTVKVSFTEGGLNQTATVINRFEYTTSAPPFLKFGFASSTGGTDNFHEIRNLHINLPGDANVAPPTAVDDSFTINQGDLSGTVLYDVTSNDVQDPAASLDKASVDLDPSVAEVQSSKTIAGKGTFTVNSSGKISFIPSSASVTGTVAVTYTINDLFSQTSNTATVTVTINSKPVANNDSPPAFNQQSSSTFSVISNDSDAEGNNTIIASTLDLDPATNAEDKSKTVSGEGTYTANNDGTVTFTPVSGFYGATTPINYTVKDDKGALSNQATISLNVIPLNFVPVAANFDIHVNEDSNSAPIGVIANATDADGNNTIVSSSIDLNPSTSAEDKTLEVSGKGTFTADDLSGTVTFSPVSNFNGAVPAISYTIKDTQGNLSVPASITITVDPVNDTPVANNDSQTIAEDAAPVTFSIIANDTDVDGNATIASGSIDLDVSTTAKDKTVTVSGKGTLTANTDGTVTFIPQPDFYGSFGPVRYTVEDEKGALSNQAEISITVTSVNDGPLAKDDVKDLNDGETVVLNLIANDIDAENELVPGSLSIVSNPTFGTVTNNFDGTASFRADAGAHGTVTFNYIIKDKDNAVSNTATVTVNINSHPFANIDYITANSSAIVTYNIVSNDTDDGTINPASINLVKSPAGSLTVKPDGSVIYQSPYGFKGVDSFSYTVVDDKGAVSNEAQVVITVNGIPEAVADAARYNADTPVDIFVLENDSDDQPKLIGNVSFTQALNGSVSVNSNGSLTYTPNPGFKGADSFTYTLKDNAGAVSNTATVSLVYNVPPVAQNAMGKINMGEQFFLDLNPLVSDADGTIDWSSIEILSGIRGTASFSIITHVITYQPFPGLYGKDTFTYRIKDNSGGVSNTATVTVYVNGFPIAANDNNIRVDAGKTIDIEVTKNDRDVDLDGSGALDKASVLIKAGTGPQHGSVINLGDGSVRYTANSNYYGSDSFQYTVKDNMQAVSNVATVNITINAVPIANPDPPAKKVNEGSQVAIDVAANDLDPDGGLDKSSVTIKNINNGEVVGTITNGIVTFKPFTGYHGPASFTYTIKDIDGAESNTVTVDILVNQRPVALDEPNVRTSQGTAVDVDVLTNDIDYDGSLSPLSLSPASPQHGKVEVINAKLRYTPDNGYYGPDEFTYTVADNEGALSNEAVVSIKINARPVTVNDVAELEINSQKDIAVLANDADPYGISGGLDVSTLRILQLPQHGATQISADGSIHYSPDQGYSGADSFTYSLKDADGLESAPATVSLIIHPASKLGLAKKLVSITKAVNGSHDVRFLFTLQNFGTDNLEQVSLTDDLQFAFKNAQVVIKSISTSGNLISNASFDGKTDMELLSKASTIAPSATATVELELNVTLATDEGVFYNSAFARATSSRNGSKLLDQSTDGTKPDSKAPGDVSAQEVTAISLEKAGQFIPGGFSPNNDGVNDKLVIENTGFNKLSIEIFNRWGNRVYKSADYKNDWDGRCTEGVRIGEDVPDGTYYYILNIENTGRYVGYITIKR